MSIEVEIKLRISDKECIEETLAEIGFCKGKFVMESDTYYMAEHHDFVGLDETLRVRCVENRGTGERSAVITYKGAKLDNTSMTRQELETSVGDGAVCREILERIGFRPVPVVEKLRQYYHRDNITACVDAVTKIIWNWRSSSMSRRNGKRLSISWNRSCIRLAIPCRIRREPPICLCF